MATVRTLRYATLPGLAPARRPYEFVLFEDGLVLHIPADHRGPDVAFALAPEQQDWLDRWPGGLRRTWDCQWTFADRSALDRFLAELGPPLAEPPVPTPALAPPPHRPAAGDAPGADAAEVRLDGGAPGNRVELARAGDIIVSLGLCDGVTRPWSVVARRAAGSAAFAELIAHWREDFPLAHAARGTRAMAHARELGGQPRLWVTHAFRRIGGAPTRRVLALDDRVAVETLGRRRRLAVYATAQEAQAQLGPDDIACGLEIPRAEELAAIAALGPPRRPRPRRPRAIGPQASLAVRLGEALRRLEADGVLALARVAGPTSEAWGVVAQARRHAHAGAVFYRADDWRSARESLYLHWASWTPASDPLAFARRVVEALAGVGVEAVLPRSVDESIVVRAPRR
jgi:hypothetical protein